MSHHSEGFELQARIESYSLEIANQLKHLLANRASIQQIAELVDAKKFLSFNESDKTWHFDVRGFIQERARLGSFVKFPDNISRIFDTIVPPDQGEIVTGSGTGMESKDLIPRSVYLAELLSDQNIGYEVVEGVNNPSMMRKESYRAFLLKDAGKVVLVNNEEGNASFVIKDVGSDEEVAELLSLTKDQLKDRPNVVTVVYPGDKEKWKDKIREALLTGEKIVTNKTENQRTNEQPPEGWAGLNALSLELTRSRDSVLKVAEYYREKNPEWFKSFKSGRWDAQYFSPQLTELLRKQLAPFEVAPNSWVSVVSMKTAFGIDRGTVYKIADAYRKNHPEWFQTYKISEAKRTAEFISPELVEIVKREYEKFPKAPEGWKNRMNLASQLVLSFGTVDEVVNGYERAHPEWFKMYRGYTGLVTEFLSPELVQEVQDYFERIKVPNGWIHMYELSKRLGCSVETIERYLVPYINDHPKEAGEFRSPEGKFFTYYSPDAIFVLSQTLEATELPSGWKAVSSLAGELKMEYYNSLALVQRYRVAHPAWFRAARRLHRGKQVLYYAPEFLAAAKANLENEKASQYEIPPGWLSLSDIGLMLGVSSRSVANLSKKYRAAHPHWFSNFRAKMGQQSFAYCSVELIPFLQIDLSEDRDDAEIEKEMAQEVIEAAPSKLETKAPEGWLRPDQIAEEFPEHDLDNNLIKSFAKEYYIKDRDLIKKIYNSELGHANLYYSPDLVEYLREFIKEILPPRGWKTAGFLAVQVGRAVSMVKERARKYNEAHPGSIKVYKHPRLKQDGQFYSPDLIESVTAELAQFTDPPEGWESISSISASAGRAYSKVEQTLKPYREANPELFKIYNSRAGRPTEYFAPELSQKILSQLNEYEVTPPGWMTNKSLCRQTSRQQEVVKAVADSFRQEHLEWFKLYRTPSGVFEHYAPELVNKIVAELTKVEVAPVGWMTPSAVSEMYGKKNTKKVVNIAATFQSAHPEWFKVYRHRYTGAKNVHYHPDLVNRINEALAQNKKTT